MSLSISPDGIHLIQAGVILFVIGLLQGLVIPKFKNSRMALSAHLTAVQSGLALIVFGIIWMLIDLQPTGLTIAKWSFILGIYLIWLGITIAACNGASKALPIAGSGYSASRVSELTVTLIEAIGVLLVILSSMLIVVGLF